MHRLKLLRRQSFIRADLEQVRANALHPACDMGSGNYGRTSVRCIKSVGGFCPRNQVRISLVGPTLLASTFWTYVQS